MAFLTSGDDSPTRPQITLPTPAMMALERIEIDLSDADAVAGFLEAVAHVIRQRRRIVLTIE